MAEIGIEELRRLAQGSGITIEGEARDLTHRKDVDEDTVNLADEPEFMQQGIRDREDLASDDDALDPYKRMVLIGAARTLVGKEIHSKRDLIKHLTAGLYLNDFGLPDYVYRADLLDDAAINALLHGTNTSEDPTTTTIPPLRVGPAGIQEVNALVDVARVPLTYDEGYPALDSGLPFWHQLSFEPKTAYDAFVFYLEQDGARKLSDLIAYEMGELKQWFTLYYWDYRVKAFDLYRVANYQRTKLRRMLSTEDRHFKMADKLFGKLGEIVESADFIDKLDKLDPEKLIKVLDTVVKVQRISTGLNATGGKSEETPPVKQHTTVNIMNTLTQNDVVRADEEQVDVLSENPDMITQVQDMLLDLQSKKGFNE